ncbi:MAG: hypothetical protein AB1716_05100, partial [Planctomycetota bacterium]
MRRAVCRWGWVIALPLAWGAGGCRSVESGSARGAVSDAAPGRTSDSRAIERALARMRRKLEIAQLALAKAHIARATGELHYRDAQDGADRELELAVDALRIFQKFSGPNRLARGELELQTAEDERHDLRRQVEQLAPGQNADAPAASAPARDDARRTLARKERELELRRIELQTLREVTLPQEEKALRRMVEERKRATLQVQREHEQRLLEHTMLELEV